MAIVKVAEAWNGRKGSARGPQFVREYKRVFKVQTSDTGDEANQILSSLLIPQLEDVYLDKYGNTPDPGAVCIQVDVDQDADNPNFWLVTAHYSSDATDPGLAKENPLDRRVEKSGDFAVYQKALEKDVNNKTLENSAGDPFEPAYSVDDSRPTWIFVRNEASDPSTVQEQYKDAINSDIWRGKSIGTVKVKSITWVERFENDVLYYAVTYSFEYRPEGWTLQALDCGFRYLDLSGAKIEITDKYGHKYSTPQLLDGTGAVLGSAGSALPANAPSQFIPFAPFKSLPFADLGWF